MVERVKECGRASTFFERVEKAVRAEHRADRGHSSRPRQQGTELASVVNSVLPLLAKAEKGRLPLVCLIPSRLALCKARPA